MTHTPKVNNAQKYDRQIRIWGDEGQVALQTASVCVLNASATTTEILKNLVLPGIGSFTVVDGRDVSPADHATNFFLTSPSAQSTSNASKPTSPKRAHAVVQAMHALNGSVRGSYIPVDASAFLTTTAAAIDFLRSFSIVIATQLSSRCPLVQCISAACASLNLPLVLARAYGMVAYIRIQVTEHCVQNARTPDKPFDLRVHKPFEELTEHLASVDFSTCTPEIASQTPFVFLLARAVQHFRQTHDGKLPSSRDERAQLSTLVRKLRPNGCPDDAENVAEALRFRYLRLCHTDAGNLPTSVLAVLTDSRTNGEHADFLKAPSRDEGIAHTFPEAVRIGWRTADVQDVRWTNANSLARGNAKWWICAQGVREFWQKHGCLPLSGVIPDMTADTTSYVRLQRLYADRALRDAREVWKYITDLIEREGLDVEVDLEATSAFCKRMLDAHVMRTRSVVDEVEGGDMPHFLEAAREEGSLDEASASTTAAPYYIMLRAVDLFESEHDRLPGLIDAMRETDLSLMHELVTKLREQVGIVGSGLATWREITEEMVRYGGAETHCVASFVGGIAAQEVTKLVTGQFVPIFDSTIVNMVTMTSVTFKV